MNQLVAPNLSVAGLPDYCLAYVQSVFGAPAVNDTAWHAWEAAQFKHLDRNLPNVAVPIWCAWSGTVEGVYSNYGHVAVWTGTEVYTNPLSGSGHKVFPSIEAMEQAYGVQFVGWSEDIETLRVAKEEIVASQDTVDATVVQLGYNGILLNPSPDPSAWETRIAAGESVGQFLNELINSPTHQDIIAGYQAGAQVPELQKTIASLTAANLKLTDQLSALKATPVVAPDPSVTVTQSGLWAAFKRFLGL